MSISVGIFRHVDRLTEVGHSICRDRETLAEVTFFAIFVPIALDLEFLEQRNRRVR